MVSIIVPNYNHALYLEERIQSILNQTYQDYELILLDDCSSDDSRFVLEQYRNHPKVSSILYNEQNSGSPFTQWQKGIEMAKGDWIWIAESDDIAEVTFLEEMLFAVRKYPSVGMAYCHLKWIDARGDLMFIDEDEDVVRYYTGKQFLSEKLVYTTTIFNVSSVIFRKSDYLKIDYTKYSSYRRSGDYMFYIQMAEVCDVLEYGRVLDVFRCLSTSCSHCADVNSHINEGIEILDYVIKKSGKCHVAILMSIIRYEYQQKYSIKDKCKVYWAYFKKGYILVPLVYICYEFYKNHVKFKR